ncbi:MAG: Ldh family oxidoreductase [Planctomycetaceae bacterium]
MTAPAEQSSDDVHVPIDGMRGLLFELLKRKSLFEFDAEVVIARMLEADLIGQREHGCRCILTFLDRMDQGEIDPRARVLTETETSAMAVLDGSSAMGHVAATQGMQLAIKKAGEVGTGTVVIHHSHHFGSAALYARMAAMSGCIGLCTSNIGPATMGRNSEDRPVFARHQFAYAVPMEEEPLLFELNNDDSSLPGSLIPSILAGLLSGGRLPIAKPETAVTNGEHFLMAIDVGTFTDPSRFGKKLVDGLTKIGGSNGLASPSGLPLFQLLAASDAEILLSSEDATAIATKAASLKISVPWSSAADN